MTGTTITRPPGVGALVVAAALLLVWPRLAGHILAAVDPSPTAPLVDSAVILGLGTALVAALASVAVAAISSRARGRHRAGEEQDHQGAPEVPSPTSGAPRDRVDVLLDALVDLREDNKALRQETLELRTEVAGLGRQVEGLSSQLATKDETIRQQRARIEELELAAQRGGAGQS